MLWRGATARDAADGVEEVDPDGTAVTARGPVADLLDHLNGLDALRDVDTSKSVVNKHGARSGVGRQTSGEPGAATVKPTVNDSYSDAHLIGPVPRLAVIALP